MEYFTFKADGRYWGVEAQAVHRVLGSMPIARVPFVPACYLGLIYYRGELFDVVDAVSLLSSGARSLNRKNKRIVLLKWNQQKLALIPDEIIGLVWFDNIKGDGTVYSHKAYTVQIITPTAMWDSLFGLSYGRSSKV